MVKSEEVRTVFDIKKHLPLVWKQLSQLGMNVDQIEMDWRYHLEYFAPRNISPSENFLQWGVETLQIRMNLKLNRIMSHPTFFNMLHYLLKDEIEKSDVIREIRELEKIRNTG
jgi:hypothetical protein